MLFSESEISIPLMPKSQLEEFFSNLSSDFVMNYDENIKLINDVSKKILKSRYLIDDNIQQVLIKLAKVKSREIDNLRGYISTVAKNTALALKKENDKYSLNLEFITPDVHTIPDTITEDFHYQNLALKALDILIIRNKEAGELLHKRFILGYAYEDLADEYSCQINNMRTKISRAVKLLREIYFKLLNPDDDPDRTLYQYILSKNKIDQKLKDDINEITTSFKSLVHLLTLIYKLFIKENFINMAKNISDDVELNQELKKITINIFHDLKVVPPLLILSESNKYFSLNKLIPFGKSILKDILKSNPINLN